MEDGMDGLAVTKCEQCSALVESRSQIVNGTGPADASLVLVGEGPGAEEDAQGEPFVGRSGQVLADTLEEIGIERSAVRITNCVRCRPPENRDPTVTELEHCRSYLEAELDAIDPAVIVTLGKVPSEHLLDRSVGVTAEAGTVAEVRVKGVSRSVVISVHPAAVLYDRSQAESLESALERAAQLSGSIPDEQARLDGY
ncbi:MAG: uracil-DNA glycosylase [Natrialbaceae archaeon]|nr:uracil-DNA glycosylase [Natrialbaceae archaeon]